MIRPVLGTIGTRIVVMASNLLVIAVAGHALGTEGLGEIGLIVLGITLIMVLNNVIGGGALVYLVPRLPARTLLLPAYLWAVFTALVAAAVMHTLPLVPEGLEWHVVLLAFIQSLYTIHFGILLGQERIRRYNTISVLQSIVLLGAFVSLTSAAENAHVGHFVTASYLSFLTSLVASAWAIRRPGKSPSTPGPWAWGAMFRHGGFTQAANLLQLLNYRLAYYLIDLYRGTSALGLYTVANQLAESAWLVPKSLGMVLHVRVSNLEEVDRQRDLTLAIMKAATAFALLVTLVILMLPDLLFQWVFGPEVVGVVPLVLLLAPGLVAMAASQALSHWSSGTGRHHHNAIGSGIGLCFTLVAGPLLIPTHGLDGAALAATLAYCANTIYQLIVFMRLTRTPWTMLLPRRSDLELVRRAWKTVRGGKATVPGIE
ncbi:MAG: polysaccharide biosynthesis C-terminal domain-containing protein [Flavobacteriales bacterium]|nr:polysaccharide biosynthesis C-terminal domain-containing protein [Flavobacteriales bacterium]